MTSTSTTPAVAVATASAAAAVAMVKPIVGGICNNVPFTGGTRDPQFAVTFPASPYMERDRTTIMKVWKACAEGIKSEFKLKKSVESDMHSFKTEINNTLKNYGCDSVFYLEKNNNFVYLIDSPDALSIEEIRKQETALRKGCQYDNQNLDLGKLLLENSIDSSIRKSLHHLIQSSDGAVSYYNLLCNHVLGQENTKLKLYQRIINKTKLSDFPGLNVTLYHEKITPALHAANNANVLPITFGCKLLANHGGPSDPGFNSLVSAYTAKMHTLHTTEQQYKETLLQLPVLEQVYRNSEGWEATHKNKGGAYVAEGLQPTAASDMSRVKCYGCNQMGHYRSDCPQEQNTSSSSAESSKKKKKKPAPKWRDVAPASGSPKTVTKNDTIYNWCTKCKKGKGHWSINHTTDTHTGRIPGTATSDATPAAASTLMELSDGGF